jgi:DNA-binding LacI/PurR family transcriptional regulator
VPDELSVLGGGGEDVPGLTCFQADWYELGRRAVQVLSRTATGLAPEHHLMPLTLRPGSTTAPNAE